MSGKEIGSLITFAIVGSVILWFIFSKMNIGG
jgi:hypothetical protein